MVSIQIIARGFKNNSRLLDALSSNEILEKLLHKLGEDIVYDAKDNIQQNQSINSGTLLASIDILEEIPAESITVGSTADHAEYIEFGRGPVRPINKKYLHWIDKDTGEDVFSKYAGPAEPQPFLQPAVEKNSKIFSDIYVEQIEQNIKKYTSSLLDAEEF